VTTSTALTADAQAIALVCSSLALESSADVRPLTPGEWHELSVTLRESSLQRPRDLLGRTRVELRDELGVPEAMAERIERLLARGGQLALELERLAARGIWVLTRADERYPASLKQQLRGQAPPLLFGAGSQQHLDAPAIAVVGSRDVDEEGLAFARALGGRCAHQRFAVVSGGARGVDAAAMEGAIEAGGVAVGITVDPLERLVRRRDLRIALSEGTLTLATPFRPDARWHAGNAMRRNRLVYALARAGVVVASSAEKGGTRAGALENLRARWVPLYVRDDGGAGARELMANGARPLPAASAEQLDVARLDNPAPLEALPPAVSRPPAEPDVIAGWTTSAIDEDLFEWVWPLLARYLQEPRSANDVAEHFDLAPTQARAWLARAAGAELVRTQARPRRYVLVGPEQETLFSPARAVGA
jgi:predicted Rossmann fold nucleotide-binding protein DprA/Smf involved in DNA uptake